MPVIAVVGAIALDAGVVGDVVAGGLAALQTLSAVTAIGATVGAIGAVTGNKALTIAGGALGVVGAIGTLALGSGALGNVSDIFGSSAGESAADAASVNSAVADSAAVSDAGAGAITTTDLPPAGAATTGATTGTDITSTTGGLEQGTFNPAGAINSSSIAPAEGNAAAIETGGQTGSALGQAISPGAAATESASGLPSWAATGGTADAAATSAKAGADILSSGITPTLGDSGVQGAVSSLSQMPSVSPNDLASTGILNWAKNNPLLSYGVIQAGGSFISGLTNPMTPAQIAALDSQANANNAAATLAQRQATNISQPLPTATTSAPTQTAGLINTKPVGSPSITGAPNTGAPTTPTVTGVPA